MTEADTTPTTVSEADTSTTTTMVLRPILSLRSRSAVLSTFPWTTDFLLRSDVTSREGTPFDRFFKAMQSLETQLSNGSASRAAMDAHTAMHLVPPGTTGLPGAVGISSASGRRLCNVITAYRLMDVLYSLRDDPPPYHNPRYGKLPLKGLQPKSKTFPLHDWVEALEEGRTQISELQKFREATKSPSEGSTNSMVIPADDDITLQAVLFKALYGLKNQTKASNMLFNLQAVAFCISFMLKGCVANAELAIPSVPDDPDAFRNATIAPSAVLTPGESAFYDTFRHHELFKLRHTASAALLISPLYLISGRKIPNNTWDQSRLLQYSKSLGNDKPDVLMRVEKELWKALLKVATGRETIYPAMETFYASIDMEEIKSVSVTDRAFFSDNNSKTAVHSLTASLLCVVGETSVVDEWPLSQLRPTITDPPASASGSSGDGRAMDQVNEDLHPVESSSNNNADEDEDEDEEREGEQMDVDDPPEPSKRPRRKTKGRVIVPREPRRRAPKRARTKRLVLPNVIPFQRLEDGSFLKTFTVKKNDTTITFDPSIEKRRFKGDKFVVVDALGRGYEWCPEFHFLSDLEKFLDFKGLVVSCLTASGQPRYLADPASSIVEVIAYDEYSKLSTAEVHRKLRDRHLVITGTPTEDVQFDEFGLLELTNLKTRIPLQDQSIPIGEDDNLTSQLRFGTLQHILDMARDPNGAIINALSFPLPLSAIQRNNFSGEIEAWHLTEGLPFCDKTATYPTGDMRWGLASTAGSRHWTHVDSDGMATFVDVKVGKKWWILLKPHLDGELDPSAHVDLYLNDFDPAIAVKTWEAEAVLLTPGTRLLMRPNTPHAVFTTEHTIVFGGHFYSFANLQDTINGIIHCFAVDDMVTNTEHPQTRVLLSRMMQYLYLFYVQGEDPTMNSALHLPDLTDFRSLMNVLALCNYCILGNVLDYDTYGFPGLPSNDKATAQHKRLRELHDYNALDPERRQHLSYVRGLAINLRYWIEKHYDFVEINDDQMDDDTGGNHPRLVNFMKDIANAYLKSHAYCLLNYKIQAENEKLIGVMNCTAKDVRHQLKLLFYDNEPIYGVLNFDDPNMDKYDTWAFPLDKYRVLEKDVPLEFKDLDPETLGTTHGDRLYHHGAEIGFPLTKAAAATLGPVVPENDVGNDDDGEADAEGDAESEDDSSESSTGGKRKRGV